MKEGVSGKRKENILAIFSVRCDFVDTGSAQAK